MALSEADEAALHASHADVSDIDPHARRLANEGFAHAYRVAEGIVAGRLDPLSAR